MTGDPSPAQPSMTSIAGPRGDMAITSCRDSASPAWTRLQRVYGIAASGRAAQVPGPRAPKSASRCPGGERHHLKAGGAL